MFIAALFIIARTWKQPRCPSADKWIRKLWYIYAMEYYSAVDYIFRLLALHASCIFLFQELSIQIVPFSNGMLLQF